MDDVQSTYYICITISVIVIWSTIVLCILVQIKQLENVVVMSSPPKKK